MSFMAVFALTSCGPDGTKTTVTGPDCAIATTEQLDPIHGFSGDTAPAADEAGGMVSQATQENFSEFVQWRDTFQLSDCTSGEGLRIVSALQPQLLGSTKQNAGLNAVAFQTLARQNSAMGSLEALAALARRENLVPEMTMADTCGCQALYPDSAGANP